MKHKITITIILAAVFSFNFSALGQLMPADSMYFGQTPPGTTPKLFAPGFVSVAGKNEPCITFSPDGTEAYFYIEFYPNPGTPYVLYSKYADNHWSAPVKPAFAEGRYTAEPFFALNGKRIYMNATNAVNQVKAVDLSYVERIDGGWSQPKSMGNPPNSADYQYHSCIVADTSLYFSSGGGSVCHSQYKNGAYLAPVALPVPINYGNETQTWGDPFVAPDESYMILKSTRAGGFGNNDIYIAYRKPDKTWTNPKNLGDKINTPADETSGDITPDGKYMTFGRNNDLYWVSTSFIDSLKHTNFVPYLTGQIAMQSASTGKLFSYTIPEGTFVDDDGNNTLTFSAALSNGNPLPNWLTFNAATRTLSGTPSASGMTGVKVTAADPTGVSVSCVFNIRTTVTGIEEGKRIAPEGIILEQNFPNPFNPSTKINFTLSGSDYVTLKVFDILGREISVLADNELMSGRNSLEFKANGLPSGMYYYCLQTSSGTLSKSMLLMK